MLQEIRQLVASLPADLVDSQHRSVFCSFSEKTSLDQELIQNILTTCLDVKKSYTEHSTVHIRVRMLENLLTHFSLEAELQSLLHKPHISSDELTRIDEIAQLVLQLESKLT